MLMERSSLQVWLQLLRKSAGSNMRLQLPACIACQTHPNTHWKTVARALWGWDVVTRSTQWVRHRPRSEHMASSPYWQHCFSEFNICLWQWSWWPVRPFVSHWSRHRPSQSHCHEKRGGCQVMHVQCMGNQCNTKQKPGTGQCWIANSWLLPTPLPPAEPALKKNGQTHWFVYDFALACPKAAFLAVQAMCDHNMLSAKFYQNITRLHPHRHTAFLEKHAAGTSAQVNVNKWHVVQRHVFVQSRYPKKKNEHQTVQHTSEPGDMMPHDGASCRPTVPCLNLRTVYVLCAKCYLPLTHTWKTCFIKQWGFGSLIVVQAVYCGRECAALSNGTQVFRENIGAIKTFRTEKIKSKLAGPKCSIPKYCGSNIPRARLQHKKQTFILPRCMWQTKVSIQRSPTALVLCCSTHVRSRARAFDFWLCSCMPWCGSPFRAQGVRPNKYITYA